MPKTTTIASYVGVFLLIMSLVAIGYQPPKEIGGTVATATNTSNKSSSDQTSVDEIVANTVAGGIAERANMPIAPSVAEHAVSLSINNELAQTDSTVISKPQIIQPGAGGRDIKTYTTKAGDTVPTVASQFGISATTVKWANNLTSDALEPGRSLSIPPVDGVVYTVVGGDTIESIAQKYAADKDRIVAFNDLEITGLSNGMKVILPSATLPNTERPGYTAPRAAVSNGGGSGYAISSTVARASAGNRYAPGNCTWYAFERRMQLGKPIGSFWGNGGSWGFSASSAGHAVNSTPAAGAIFVEAGSPGHVGVVESVDANGNIRVTEMNNYAYGGFNIVNSRNISAGQAGAYKYIH